MFPEIGVPPNHPFSWHFPWNQPSSYWDTPHTGPPPPPLSGGNGWSPAHSTGAQAAPQARTEERRAAGAPGEPKNLGKNHGENLRKTIWKKKWWKNMFMSSQLSPEHHQVTYGRNIIFIRSWSSSKHHCPWFPPCASFSLMSSSSLGPLSPWFFKKTRRRMARERRGAESSVASMETLNYKTIYWRCIIGRREE